MGRLQLTKYQHQRLVDLTNSHSRFIARKAMALLELSSGKTQEQVAENFGVTARSVRNWLYAFQQKDLRLSLKDGRLGHSGRTTVWSDKVQRQFQKAIKVQPNEIGYQAVVWTVDLLRIHLMKKTGVGFSSETLRRRLHEQKYVWKRPKYQLLADPEKRKKNHLTPALLS